MQKLSSRLQLKLYGVDGKNHLFGSFLVFIGTVSCSCCPVVVEEGSNDIYVIDINYFPGYAGVESFPSSLCRYDVSFVCMLLDVMIKVV
jgi:hypothetical protein